ncbi:MAG: HigA family addiction module antidote protein [Verrucomicrobia bacterium]|nr:HigA family addiction module antidote protein [Verrucomicrobiota bacterium]
MMPKKRKPTALGEILNEEFLRPLGLTPRAFAEKLGSGWSEKRVKDVIAGAEPFSANWAPAFAELLGTTPEFWVHLNRIEQAWAERSACNEKGSLKPWKKAC